MASILKHLRSSTADKRPTASGLADGQIAINTASGTPAMFFKDSAGNIVKVGPAHIGTTAPNVSPAGSAGNSDGELWIDESLTTRGLKYYDGATFVNLTPSGTTSTVGLVELATDAETQAGSDNVRAVTPSGLQSKISDSVSTTSSTTIASSTAVKNAYDLANAALPKAGGTLTGELLISPSGSLVFEGSSDDSFETTIAVVNPTADRTITFPNVTGTVITTGDTGTVTSAMIADGTIVDGDVSASAAIAGTKISPNFGSQTIETTGIVSHALGSAAAPTLTFTGDTNTGVYSPGADQVAISTNGTGRLTIDSSGNVNIDSGTVYIDAANNRLGVGTTSPGYLVTAATSADGVDGVSVESPSVNGVIRLRADGTNGNAIRVGGVGAQGNTLRFLVGSDVERARIDSSGRLLVGTDSARAVFNNTTGTAALQVEGSTANTANLSITRTSADTGPSLLTFAKSRGSVGGTPTVVASGDLIGFISFEGADGTEFVRGASISAEVDGTPGANDMPGRLVFSTTADGASSPTERLRITSAGNVGIGTTSPGGALHVSNGNDSASGEFVGLIIGGTNQNNARTASLIKDTTTYDLIYRNNNFSSALGSHVFKNGNTEHARIDSSGRLLVGTTSGNGLFNGGTQNPQFQIEGTTGNTILASLTANRNDAAGPTFYLAHSRGTAAGGTTVLQSGDQCGILAFAGADGTDYVTAATITAQVDGTPGANDMPGRLVFGTTADGASSPTERLRIDSSGRVGIGTTPAYALDVATASNLSFRTKNTDIGSALQAQFHNDSDLGVNIISYGSSYAVGSVLNVGANGSAVNVSRDLGINVGSTYTLRFGVGNTERARIDSSGRLGIGTADPGTVGQANYRNLVISSATNTGITINSSTGAAGGIIFNDTNGGLQGSVAYEHSSDSLQFAVNGSERMRVDSSGRLLVGTSTNRTNAGIQLEGTSTSYSVFSIINNQTGAGQNGSLIIGRSKGSTVGSNTVVASGDTLGELFFQGTDGTALRSAASISAFVDGTPGANDMPGRLVFSTTEDGAATPTERMRIDSSGRLLVGTSTALPIGTSSSALQIADSLGYQSLSRWAENTGGPGLVLGKSRGATPGSYTIVQNNDDLGSIFFAGDDGTDLISTGARISCQVDGTPGANDMPGRLVFFTTADGASSPTERMRIDNIGSVMIGTTSVAVGVGNTLTGVGIAADGYVAMSRSSGPAAYINRNTTDGTIVSLRQAGTEEGTISVSGTTVSYNGAHLSRWSQLPNGAERTEILRGSVLSNIDEMCEWGDEENEQLNRMKVSDVEGDKNVSGVFQAWDDDDDTYTNDFYCAMTGDFIIRIAEGVTVERGDLLMSAGDGTAKPQDDDIIRSKTIAKVTSTNVSCTYDDGSYCVPCVLMAC